MELGELKGNEIDFEVICTGQDFVCIARCCRWGRIQLV